MKKSFGLQWHVTNNCDQRCQHCYIWQKHDVEGLKQSPAMEQCRFIVDDFLDFCSEMDVLPYFSITGGDPLLYVHIWDLLEYVHQKGIGFTILGNPFHLTPPVVSRLKELGCGSYQMSIDGMEKTHDEMRKSGSFNATVNAISLLNSAGIKSMIMSTVSLLNYKELSDVARLCVQNKVKSFAFARYCPTHGDTQYNMSPEQYRTFLAEMWETYTELIDRGTFFSLKDHLWVPFLYEEGFYKIDTKANIAVDGCNCGIRHMTLLPNNTVYACRRFDSPVGKIGDKSFKEIFFSFAMDGYRKIDHLKGCGKCDLLNYCRGCHAVSAGTTGSFFDKDPQCWRL